LTPEKEIEEKVNEVVLTDMNNPVAQTISKNMTKMFWKKNE